MITEHEHLRGRALLGVKPSSEVRAMAYKSRSGTNPVRKCVLCLYSVGFGLRSVERATGYAACNSRQWLKRIGVFREGDGKAQQKRGQRLANARRREARFPGALRAFWPSCRVEKVNKVKVNKVKANKTPRTAEQTREAAEQTREAARQYYKKNAKAINQRTSKRWKHDHAFRMRRALRRRMWFLVTTAGAVKRRSNVLVGCSDVQLKDWITAKLNNGMTWDNYGEWEIDHIMPCASFDLSNTDDQLKCFHYTNLQPLWRSDNRRKGAAIPTNHQPELAMSLIATPTCPV